MLGSLLHRVGLDVGPMPSHPQGETTLWQVRFPRVVMAALVGACLGTAGALMQGVFGNPLAEPGVVARIENCRSGWCRITIDKREGFISAADIRGVAENEVVD